MLNLIRMQILWTCLFFFHLTSIRTLVARPFKSTTSIRSVIYDDINNNNNGNILVETVFDQPEESISLTSPPPLATSVQSDDEIERRILNAAPILGFYQDSSDSSLSNWMSTIPNEALITSLSIPGTHDSATWNYTQPTQESLEPITGRLPPAIAFQCQDQSLFQMLRDGIRFFDLRVGFLPDQQQLGFFHASALLSVTATLPDVLLGFYKWLDNHPTETVLLSIKVDNGTFGNPPSRGQPSSEKLQQMMYELLTQSDLAQRYWLQEDSKLSTLGQARGKLIFIQRIEWDLIRGNPNLKPIGIPLPPSRFNDNDRNFEIVYNPECQSKAFIEDFYNILPNPTSVQAKIDSKVKAIEEHFKMSASSDPNMANELFITFASGGALRNIPPVTPKMLAIGTGKDTSLNNSVNGRIKRLIEEQYDQGQRLGIVIFDWYHQLPGLIESVINQNKFLSPNPASDEQWIC